MDLELQWLLLALPVAFALGWLASRFDLRQLRQEREESPGAYFKGLNLLLNEQQDQAVDAFIQAVQNDPDTAELHFALGNLFRRRGEFERAVRVHEHLLGRADLKAADRARAQLALAQDFMKAGLFDRAETAWRALKGTAYDHDAQLALLSLYERSRDWPQAAAVARQLVAASANLKATPAAAQPAGAGTLQARIAHYECEMVEALDAQGDTAQADAALLRAQQSAAESTPGTVRPEVLTGQRLRRAGQHAQALQAWDLLRQNHPAAFVLVAPDYADSALQCADPALRQHAQAALAQALAAFPSVELLRAIEKLRSAQAAAESPAVTSANSPARSPASSPADTPSDTPSDQPAESQAHTDLPVPADPFPQRLPQLLQHLQQHPSLSGAQLLLELPPAQWNDEAWAALRTAVTRAAKPLQRYRCAACGFEAQHYFWQCPGCLSWDSYPAHRLDAL